MLSIVPFMRPWTTASRMASGVTVAADEALDGLLVVVVEGLGRAHQLVVARRADRAVEQAERLQAGLHLVHGRQNLAPSGAGSGGTGVVDRPGGSGSGFPRTD